VKGVPDGQAEIIVCADNFHGRTLGIIGFSTDPGHVTISDRSRRASRSSPSAMPRR
jgi:acetylornithine/succinyldiaminopimelate/putrescine aminotransferase